MRQIRTMVIAAASVFVLSLFFWTVQAESAEEKGSVAKWWRKATDRSPAKTTSTDQKKAVETTVKGSLPASPAKKTAEPVKVLKEDVTVKAAATGGRPVEVGAPVDAAGTMGEEAQGAAFTKPEVGDEQPDKKEMPLDKGKMVEIIERRVTIFPQIVFMIPDFSVETAEDGKKTYYFTPEGGERTKLSDLEKEELRKVFVRVNNEATRLNTERVMKQLQQQEQLMRTLQQQQQQQLQQQRTIQQMQQQQPPKVFTPPPQPPRQPQVPAGPPATATGGRK